MCTCVSISIHLHQLYEDYSISIWAAKYHTRRFWEKKTWLWIHAACANIWHFSCCHLSYQCYVPLFSFPPPFCASAFSLLFHKAIVSFWDIFFSHNTTTSTDINQVSLFIYLFQEKCQKRKKHVKHIFMHLPTDAYLLEQTAANKNTHSHLVCVSPSRQNPHPSSHLSRGRQWKGPVLVLIHQQ